MTSVASSLGHLQLRHVTDAGQLEVLPAGLPGGDVPGRGDGHQAVLDRPGP